MYIRPKSSAMKTKLYLALLSAALSALATEAQTGLYPDLQTIIPQHLQIQNTQQRELLRFSNGIANTGAGDLRLRAQNPIDDINQPQLAVQEILDAGRNIIFETVVSEFEYHPAHKHWHINDVALFEIHSGSPTGPLAGTTSVKVTFCLIDWFKLDGNSKTPDRNYFDCYDIHQGISPGWVDQYHHELEGQELDITGIQPGLYYLVSTCNPEHHFLETSYLNNTAWVSFILKRDSSGNPKIEITGNSPCGSPGLCGVGIPNR